MIQSNKVRHNRKLNGQLTLCAQHFAIVNDAKYKDPLKHKIVLIVDVILALAKESQNFTNSAL